MSGCFGAILPYSAGRIAPIDTRPIGISVFMHHRVCPIRRRRSGPGIPNFATIADIFSPEHAVARESGIIRFDHAAAVPMQRTTLAESVRQEEDMALPNPRSAAAIP
ncbi:hypothetical protein [Burkholderia sp. RF4-BP95]|uniref:hypothetical protein n=1 Tax=Burkholderia sp. RF4-BP95 TaxID=1637845 RepID=UPI0012E39E5C|nr:hypothetical protein [Burkholderia sp. RF4-BP95]